jgi:hypothetical protein
MTDQIPARCKSIFRNLASAKIAPLRVTIMTWGQAFNHEEGGGGDHEHPDGWIDEGECQ